MRIEIILLGIIILVFLTDFIKYDRYYEGDLFEKYQNNELTFVSKKTMEPITGIIYSKYENIGIVINGKANGIFTIYNGARFKDYKYFEKSNYSNGKLDGLSKVWESRNRKRLIKEANYKNGRLNGSYKEWSYRGQLLKDENYINDKLNGSYRKYYGDKVEVIGNYLNGKKSGSWSVSHLKKEKEIFLNFKNGLFESGENLNELGFYFTPSNGWKKEKRTYQDLIEVIQYAKNTLNKDVTFSHILIKNDFKIYFYGVNITDLFMN